MLDGERERDWKIERAHGKRGMRVKIKNCICPTKFNVIQSLLDDFSRTLSIADMENIIESMFSILLRVP